MLETNVKIISTLRTFLLSVSLDTRLRSLFTTSDIYFTRKRKLTFEHIALFILGLNKKTLSTELENYFDQLQIKLKCSVSAFTQQRIKLEPYFFKVWNDFLCTSFYSTLKNRAKRWKGFLVLACDGSSITLINRPELYNYFGGQGVPGGKSVLAKTFYCFDVLNKLILHSAINPYRYSEFQMACDLIDSGKLKSNYLMIFDRLYSAYNIVALIKFNETNVNYVIRTNTNYNYAKSFIRSRKKSAIIDLFPSENAKKNLLVRGYKIHKKEAVKVRLVRVELPKNKVEVLMTSLMDEQKYTSSEFKNLYSLRWGVETNIDFQKNILQLESMSGCSVITIKQDFYATVLSTNLHFMIAAPAQEIVEKKLPVRKYPMKINMNKASGKIKLCLVALFKSDSIRKILVEIQQYIILYLLPVRKGRTFPRVRKNLHSRSKHRTFTNYKPAF